MKKYIHFALQIAQLVSEPQLNEGIGYCPNSLSQPCKLYFWFRKDSKINKKWVLDSSAWLLIYLYSITHWSSQQIKDSAGPNVWQNICPRIWALLPVKNQQCLLTQKSGPSWNNGVDWLWRGPWPNWAEFPAPSSYVEYLIADYEFIPCRAEPFACQHPSLPSWTD